MKPSARLPHALQQPETLLLVMAFVMPLTFSVWQALLNNFVVERAAFSGAEIGMLQSLREVPGFLAFTSVFVLLLLREQSFAVLALALMSASIAVTGYFPSTIGLYLSTVLMSIGFHYFETVNSSLTLQWLPQSRTAHFMGRALAVRSVAALLAYGGIWLLMGQLQFSFESMYLLAGGIGLLISAAIWMGFPHFTQPTTQRRQLVLRRRYWLYYGLQFLAGARRQIFMVFAGFMMVEKFGYQVSDISALFLLNYVLNLFFAERIGRWIGRIGERRALSLEYTGLVIVFISYGFVQHAWLAAGLYVLDHFFFAMAIAISTYFQKIADPADIAGNAGVSFTINHIAAVVIPVLLGLVWLESPRLVFLIGAGFAMASLLLARLIPRDPRPGREALLFATTADNERPVSSIAG